MQKKKTQINKEFPYSLFVFDFRYTYKSEPVTVRTTHAS